MREDKENLQALDKTWLPWGTEDLAPSKHHQKCGSCSSNRAKNERIAVNDNQIKSQWLKAKQYIRKPVQKTWKEKSLPTNKPLISWNSSHMQIACWM